MDVTKQYAIAWKGLKNGTYRFDFKVDNALFEALWVDRTSRTATSVGVTLERGESMLSLQTVIRGTVTVACDRCLEDCRLPVAFDGTLLVRFSGRSRRLRRRGDVDFAGRGGSVARTIYL